MKIVAAIYTHPEYYPPTLNALEELSKSCDKIYVLARNLKINSWIYPRNVELKLSGKYRPMSYIKIASWMWKGLSFVQFTLNFFFCCGSISQNGLSVMMPYPCYLFV